MYVQYCTEERADRIMHEFATPKHAYTPLQHISQLHLIVHQPNLLSWLERRQTNVRTAIAPEGIAQGAIATASHLALHGEIDFCQVVCLQFR